LTTIKNEGKMHITELEHIFNEQIEKNDEITFLYTNLDTDTIDRLSDIDCIIDMKQTKADDLHEEDYNRYHTVQLYCKPEDLLEVSKHALYDVEYVKTIDGIPLFTASEQKRKILGL
jgi:hypothetical protein